MIGETGPHAGPVSDRAAFLADAVIDDPNGWRLNPGGRALSGP